MPGDGLSQGGVGEGGLDLLPLAILRLDGLGRILGANCAAQTLLRLDLDAPCFLEDVLEGPGRPIRDWLALALEDSAASKSEFLRVKQRDRDFFVQVSLTQVEQSEGRRLLAVLSDVTEIKTLEEQFAQSQKMQAIGELAGGIAHDFNNLLTAISGHCDLLLRHRDTGDSDYADLVQIRQNSNRAAALVGQLLAFSRKQTLRPEVIDLRDVLAELAHLLNRLVGERVSLMLEIDPDIHNLRADRRQLEQVMMNLVVNARDAMGGQGQILIAAGNQSIATPLVRDQVTVPSGDYLVIEVEDAGCGIPPDLLQKVFEPFYTTKGLGKGTGLGLSTVYGIVKQSGGFVFVDSVVGEGTRVSLMFPAVQEAAVLPTPAPRLPAAAPVDGEGVILLVEDEAPVRAFASRALRLSGFTVLEAASAEEALDLLEDPGLEVDLFLTDVIMPGLDGPTWVRRALRSRPNVRVIFVSGYAEDAFDGSHEDIMRAEFLPKPFSLEDLTKTVQAQFLAETG
jgi:two-component system cell cycle sensor histidine kinase/response regulator CckA